MRISIDNISEYILLFCINPAIFIGCRIAMFFFIQVFCCGCQCSESDANEYDAAGADPVNNYQDCASLISKYDKIYDDPYCKYLLSYNYEEFQTSFRNLEGRGVVEEVREEIQMNRLRRGESMRNIQQRHQQDIIDNYESNPN